MRRSPSGLRKKASTFLLCLGLACDRRPHPPAAVSPPPPPPPPPPVTRTFPLSPGPGLERTLAAGAVDAWEIDLPADTYVEATFEQKGVDLVIDVFAPGHRRLYQIDSPNETQGPEDLHLIAESTGRFRFEVSAPSGSGTYRALLRTVRAPSARDRLQAAADRSLYEAKEIDARPERFRDAVARYEQAVHGFQAAGDRPRQAYALYRLARLQRDRGQPREALPLFLRSHEIFRTLQDDHFLIITGTETGTCYKDLADFEHAAASYQEALDLSRRTGDEKEQATVLHNLGTLFQAHGHPWEALRSFRASLELRGRQSGAAARADEADTLTGIGWVYTSTGQWTSAVDAHRRALLLRNRLGDRPQSGISLLQIGAVWLQIDPHRAPPYFERAWELLKDTGRPRDQAAALNGLGISLRRVGRYDEAQAAFRKALRLYSTPPDPAGQAVTWTNLGRTEVELGLPDQALTSFANGLRLARAMHNPMAESRALLGMATAELARGNAAAAQARAEASLALVESLRAAVLRQDLQSSYLAANESAYGLLIRILMESHRRQPGTGYDLQALSRSEQARARVLLDALRTSREPRSGDSPERRALLAEIAARDAQRRRPGLDPADVAAAEAQLSEKLERLNELGLSGLTPPASLSHLPPDLQTARRFLDDDTVLLEYALGSPQSYLWLVSADAVQSFELPARETLEPLLRSVYAELSDPQSPPESAAILTLSRHLLGPVVHQIAGKRLLIAADSIQQAIPFAALPEPYGRHEPLVIRHEIVSVPSLAVLAELRRRAAERRPAPRLLALLADPVFDPSDARLAALVRTPLPELQDRFLSRLLQSRQEADAVAALVPSGQAFTALDFAASRDLVLSGRLSAYRILHIATHGLLRQDHPELSALVLSRFDRDGTPRDGYLRLPDLEALHLPADLVVLSACNTALGRETPGEGLVGLPQAFFTAGATRVLVSLWRVEDASTAALMTTFYRRLLLAHDSPAAALRQAQLAVRAQPRWSAPRYWAGFVLQGDWK
jgi:CHAT domain-containing protein/Tfp pilus assembly protein PilF